MTAVQLAVTIAALAAGTICFFLYVYATIAAIRARGADLRALRGQERPEAVQPRTVGVEDITRLADALGKLTDSLSSASPALTALIGSLVFYTIAAFASGALHGQVR
jgi:hypothetical protein